MSDASTKLSRLRAVCDAATEGPWAWVQPGQKENGFVVGAAYPPHSGLLEEPIDEDDELEYPEIVDDVCEQWGATVNYGDAEFIALSRTALPALVDALERVLGHCALVNAAEGCTAHGTQVPWVANIRAIIAAALENLEVPE